jgi:hypothetical protein
MREYRPDRVVRVLTGVASIAYFGLLVVATVAMIGLPAVKLLDRESRDWTIGLPVQVVSLDSDATVITRWGDARLEVEDMRGSLKLPVAMLPWWLFVILWVYLATAMALMLMFLHHLRRIFQRVQGGAPFDATNALRLRWLGILLVAVTVLSGASASVTAMAVRGGLITEDVEVPLVFSVNGGAVLFGLLLLALAEIFRRGAELEDEQAMTV